MQTCRAWRPASTLSNSLNSKEQIEMARTGIILANLEGNEMERRASHVSGNDV